jgi:hypothetical protein
VGVIYRYLAQVEREQPAMKKTKDQGGATTLAVIWLKLEWWKKQPCMMANQVCNLGKTKICNLGNCFSSPSFLIGKVGIMGGTTSQRV